MTGIGRRGPADDIRVFVGGYPSMSSSILTALESAGSKMDQAVGAIDPNDPGSYVDAAMAMSSAKLDMGVAGALARTQNEMFASTLNMLV